MQNDRVAVITGASSWTGHGAACRLADRGLSLVLAAPRATVIDRLAEECRELGVGVVTVRADASRDEDAALIASRAVDAFGGFDVWINNCGVGATGPFERARALDDETIVRTNLLGTLHGSHHALVHFRRRRRGVLINLAFAPGRIPSPYYAACTATRFGIVGLGAALREELHENNLPDVRVCTVLPSAAGPLSRLFTRTDDAVAARARNAAASSDNGVSSRAGDAETAGIGNAPAGASKLADLIVHLVDQPRDEVVAERTGWRKVGATETNDGVTNDGATSNGVTGNGQHRWPRSPAVRGAHLDATPLRASMSVPGESTPYARRSVPRDSTKADDAEAFTPESEAGKTPGRLAAAGVHDEVDQADHGRSTA